MLHTIWHSEYLRFIFLPLLAWLIVSLFLYGFLGPRWWKREAKDYADKYMDGFWRSNKGKNLNAVQVVIALLDLAVPTAVILWFLLHH